MNTIKEIKQYLTRDGSCFDSRAEAEEYEELLQNSHFKKLQERIEKLEADLYTLRTEVSTKTWFRDAAINHPPYYNTACMMCPPMGQPEQKEQRNDNRLHIPDNNGQ